MAARSRGSKGGRGAEGQPAKVKVKLCLSAESVHWLRVQALGRGSSPSAVVDDLVRKSPAEFVLTRRSLGSQGSQGTGRHDAQEPRGGVGGFGVVSSEAG